MAGMAGGERIVFQRQELCSHPDAHFSTFGDPVRTKAVFSQKSKKKPPLTQQPTFARVKKASLLWQENQIPSYYTVSTGKYLLNSKTQGSCEDLWGLQLVSQGLPHLTV